MTWGVLCGGVAFFSRWMYTGKKIGVSDNCYSMNLFSRIRQNLSEDEYEVYEDAWLR